MPALAELRACAFRFRDAANSSAALNARVCFHTRVLASVRGVVDDKRLPFAQTNGTARRDNPSGEIDNQCLK